MIDPSVSLAFSVYSNPGVFALLLGSGLSRAAGVPTGWEVVRDLIHKLAAVKGEQLTQEPEVWYKSAFGADPDYSDLLDELAKTPGERSQVLKSYFEATEEERERGVKMPTPAHRAIAGMVKAEFLRIIVTTNFDRLLEIALADLGIQPQVISTADAVKGALPLPHAKCFVLKVNGDYLDSRIKNTKAELANYDSALNTLLDRIFDEFGLVVCGWSGEWDIALRLAIDRCPSRRFSMYWATRGEPTPRALELIQRRAGIVVPIESADSFFTTLKENVFALQQLGKEHPLSAKIASAQTKRYIVRPENRILLHDLVQQETERVYSKMDPLIFHSDPAKHDESEASKRFGLYESIVEILLSTIAVGCYWGQEEHEYLWQRLLQRVGDPPGSHAGVLAWIEFRLYPAALLMYVGGIAAIRSRRWRNLAAVFKTPITRIGKQEVQFAAQIFDSTILREGLLNMVPGQKGKLTPFSNHLFEVLREPLRDLIPADADYEDAFLLFEYLQGVFAWFSDPGWAPVGRPRWRRSAMYTASGPTAGSNPLIVEAASTLFPKGVSDYDSAKAAYDRWVLQNTQGWH